MPKEGKFFKEELKTDRPLTEEEDLADAPKDRERLAKLKKKVEAGKLPPLEEVPDKEGKRAGILIKDKKGKPLYWEGAPFRRGHKEVEKKIEAAKDDAFWDAILEGYEGLEH